MSILCGLAGFVFIDILCAPFEVFGWWPPLLRRALFGSEAIKDYEDMKRWQVMIYKPLAGCGICNAGWWSIAYFFAVEYTKPFEPFYFIFFVFGGIYTAWFLYAFKHTIYK